MLSSHLILCRPLLLLPPIPPSIRVFSNEPTLGMRRPKYWSFSFSIIPSKEIPGLISFRMDWLDLLAVQGTLKSLLQCPSPTPGFYPDSCPSSWWCHPAISSSVIPFSSCPQCLPASESFPVCQLFTRGGQSIGVSASASVLPMNTQDWSPLGWAGWTFLQSKGLSRVFSNTTVQKHQFFGTQFSSQSNSHIHTWHIEMQIQTTMRYHLTLVRMVNIRKSTSNKCWRECGEKRTFLYCWCKCKLVFLYFFTVAILTSVRW